MTTETEQYAAEMFPSNYASWRYCIEVKCRIALTSEFLHKRIAVLSDPKNQETRRFSKLYGEPYHKQVLTWFQRAAAED